MKKLNLAAMAGFRTAVEQLSEFIEAAMYGPVVGTEAYAAAWRIKNFLERHKNAKGTPSYEAEALKIGSELVKAAETGTLHEISSVFQRLQDDSGASHPTMARVIIAYVNHLVRTTRDFPPDRFPTVKEVREQLMANMKRDKQQLNGVPDDRTIRYVLNKIGIPYGVGKRGRPPEKQRKIIRK